MDLGVGSVGGGQGDLLDLRESFLLGLSVKRRGCKHVFRLARLRRLHGKPSRLLSCRWERRSQCTRASAVAKNRVSDALREIGLLALEESLRRLCSVGSRVAREWYIAVSESQTTIE